MKTVQVRIAVAVDSDGNWFGYGDPEVSDSINMDAASEYAKILHCRYWVTAELPIPEVKEIPGTVEKADE